MGVTELHTLQEKLISAACIHDLIVSVTTQTCDKMKAGT